MHALCEYHSHVDEEVLKQCPHVRARVYLLHLHLGVNVTVIQKVDVRHLDLFIKQQHNQTQIQKFKTDVADTSRYTKKTPRKSTRQK